MCLFSIFIWGLVNKGTIIQFIFFFFFGNVTCTKLVLSVNHWMLVSAYARILSPGEIREGHLTLVENEVEVEVDIYSAFQFQSNIVNNLLLGRHHAGWRNEWQHHVWVLFLKRCGNVQRLIVQNKLITRPFNDFVSRCSRKRAKDDIANSARNFRRHCGYGHSRIQLFFAEFNLALTIRVSDLNTMLSVLHGICWVGLWMM